MKYFYNIRPNPQHDKFLFYNSILWFYEEVVAKNNKRDREYHRVGVRGTVVGHRT